MRYRNYATRWGERMGDIEKAVKWAIDIANDNAHGYDQVRRNSPDFDCSSFVATALNYGGFNVPIVAYTGNLLKHLLSVGFKQVSVSAKRERGDIFLTPYKHVVLCVDSEHIVHASINEKGTTKGGKTGDQTGKEICTRKFYTPKYGWKYHLRYCSTKQELDQLISDVISGKYGNGIARKNRLESLGYNYKEIQKLVNDRLKG